MMLLRKRHPHPSFLPVLKDRGEIFRSPASQLTTISSHLPSLHCTVIVFAMDWESHKSLKHDRECLTWARMFSVIPDSTNPTSRGRLEIR